MINSVNNRCAPLVFPPGKPISDAHVKELRESSKKMLGDAEYNNLQTYFAKTRIQDFDCGVTE